MANRRTPESVLRLPRHLRCLLRYQLQEVRIGFLTGQILPKTGQRSCCHAQRTTCTIWIRLIKFLFQKFGVKLVVHSTCSQVLQTTREQELSEDLLAIINVFITSNNGRRAAEYRRS